MARGGVPLRPTLGRLRILRSSAQVRFATRPPLPDQVVERRDRKDSHCKLCWCSHALRGAVSAFVRDPTWRKAPSRDHLRDSHRECRPLNPGHGSWMMGSSTPKSSRNVLVHIPSSSSRPAARRHYRCATWLVPSSPKIIRQQCLLQSEVVGFPRSARRYSQL
jgi:hypothetical protein